MNKRLFKGVVDMDEGDMDSNDIEQMSKLVATYYGQDNLRYNLHNGHHIDVIQKDSHISKIFFNDDSRFFEPPSTPRTDLLRKTKEILDRYFDGEPVDFRDISVKIEVGTVFQKSVWDTIHQIPHGEVRSYQWIAEHIGRPKAVRAVGSATGNNPITIVIPCHRVIGSNGNLGGYGGGLELKRQLLSLEGYPVKELKSKRKVSSQ